MAEVVTAALDVNKDGNLDVEDAKAAAVAAKKTVEEVIAKAKQEGFFSGFVDYNTEIIRPFKEFNDFSGDALKQEIIATLKLSPTSPRNGFVLYNVVALFFGIIESILAYLLGGGIISLIWNGALGYIIAYTLYWTVTCYRQPRAMQFALAFLLLYVLFSVWMAFKTILFVIPAALYGVKAFINLLQLVNGVKLLQEQIGDKSLFQML
eukprot:CAMPEP_0174714832 /NCGR_PEP_ID=MMETSP1094-20130205/19418_1 /TAXON_ID=156173 /ORGANISM="Chrysochromulina brevifilum, Strain UTEX LB 985" /LENGTH=207 /DNA_ID=CAMNT_0015914273 /DNA_START=31 /DNA_END=654 /DNA_ORIENTATION=+